MQVLLQLGSSLRNVRRVTEALAVLGEAAGLAPESVAPPAFRALALVGIGAAPRAVSELLAVVLQHVDDSLLGRYRRALTDYAAELT